MREEINIMQIIATALRVRNVNRPREREIEIYTLSAVCTVNTKSTTHACDIELEDNKLFACFFLLLLCSYCLQGM